VATVERGHKQRDVVTRFNGEEAVELASDGARLHGWLALGPGSGPGVGSVYRNISVSQ